MTKRHLQPRYFFPSVGWFSRLSWKVKILCEHPQRSQSTYLWGTSRHARPFTACLHESQDDLSLSKTAQYLAPRLLDVNNGSQGRLHAKIWISSGYDASKHLTWNNEAGTPSLVPRISVSFEETTCSISNHVLSYTSPSTPYMYTRSWALLVDKWTWRQRHAWVDFMHLP